MKVLHISYGDLLGGANKAAYSIHKSILEYGIDSKMLVMVKSSEDKSVIAIKKLSKSIYYKNQIKQKLARIILRLQKTDNENLHSINLFSSGIHKLINGMDADIVNLHWVNCEMISIKEISKIKKPIIWTLADMWPYCGSEHYTEDDSSTRYINGYQKKNRPLKHRGIDLDRFTWKRKKLFWLDKKINLIATSNWNAKCAQKSALFNKAHIDIVPQSIDLNIFKSHDKLISRNIHNLPKDKFLILFAAPNAIKDKRKGYSHLKKSLKNLSKNRITNQLELVVLGSTNKNIEKELGIKTHYINFLYDDISRVLLYNSVDVLLAPSIQENLSNIVMESLASCLPVVAFNIGGMPDLIDHKINGYLAKPFDCEDFSKGIISILDSNKNTKKLSKAARKKAEKCFSSKIVASQYEKIYNERLIQ